MSKDFNFSILFRILALEKLGAVFNQVAFPLQYTPRKFVIHPETNNLVLIETDHNAYTEATKAQRKQQMAEVRNSLKTSQLSLISARHTFLFLHLPQYICFNECFFVVSPSNLPAKERQPIKK